MAEHPPDGSEAEGAAHVLDPRRWLVGLRQAARQGYRRATGALAPVLWATLAAFASFLIAHDVFGHQQPFFAPIAAWVCLGFTFNRVPRKVVELGLGAVLGVALGEVILILIGSGAPQIAIGLAVGATLGRFLDRGDLFTMQSGVNAMVVIGMGGTAGASAGFSRMLDALIGAFVAFVFSVLLPRNLARRPKRYLRGVYGEIATCLGTIQRALQDGNAATMGDAATELHGLESIVDDAREVIASAQQIARLNPILRADRPVLDECDRQRAIALRLARTLSMLIRQGRGVIVEAGRQPGAAALVGLAGTAMRAHATALAHWQPPDLARRLAVQLADACAPGAVPESDWRGSMLVSLMRSIAIDALQATGLSRGQARAHLPDVADEVTVQDAPTMSEEGPSAIWGVDGR